MPSSRNLVGASEMYLETNCPTPRRDTTVTQLQSENQALRKEIEKLEEQTCLAEQKSEEMRKRDTTVTQLQSENQALRKEIEKLEEEVQHLSEQMKRDTTVTQLQSENHALRKEIERLNEKVQAK
jgi:peptidoglycan hydrolase CwlO-like protein